VQYAGALDGELLDVRAPDERTPGAVLGVLAHDSLVTRRGVVVGRSWQRAHRSIL
jgi:hypothetical protein